MSGPRRDEPLDPALLAALRAAIPVGSTIHTVAQRRPNRIVGIDEFGVMVETERSTARQAGAQLVPAWMLNTAWRHLRKFRSLTLGFLLDDLKVKRSAAVFAILARLDDVDVATTRPTTLVLRHPIR